MKRKRQVHTLREYLILAGLGVLVLWLMLLVYGIARKEEVAREAVKDTEAELASLETRRQTLEADLAALNTERGQEAVLRETFGVAKPGEEVIIVVPPKEIPPPPPQPWWKKVLNFFGGN